MATALCAAALSASACFGTGKICEYGKPRVRSEAAVEPRDAIADRARDTDPESETTAAHNLRQMFRRVRDVDTPGQTTRIEQFVKFAAGKETYFLAVLTTQVPGCPRPHWQLTMMLASQADRARTLDQELPFNCGEAGDTFMRIVDVLDMDRDGYPEVLTRVRRREEAGTGDFLRTMTTAPRDKNAQIGQIGLGDDEATQSVVAKVCVDDFDGDGLIEVSRVRYRTANNAKAPGALVIQEVREIFSLKPGVLTRSDIIETDFSGGR